MTFQTIWLQSSPESVLKTEGKQTTIRLQVAIATVKFLFCKFCNLLSMASLNVNVEFRAKFAAFKVRTISDLDLDIQRLQGLSSIKVLMLGLIEVYR
jgi:hypothetical protein